MSRTRRIALAHIVQRGHNRKNVFRTEKDRSAYLDTLREFREKLELRVFGYCLMSNHVHLIIDPGADPTNLRLLMNRLAGRHTRRINRLERRTAHRGKAASSAAQSNRIAICLHARDTLTSILSARRWSDYSRTIPGQATALASALSLAIGFIMTRASSLSRALKNDGSGSIKSSSSKASMSTSSDSYEVPFNEINSRDQRHSFCKSNASPANGILPRGRGRPRNAT